MAMDTFDTPLENVETTEIQTPDENLTMDDMDELEEEETLQKESKEEKNADKIDPENDQTDDDKESKDDKKDDEEKSKDEDNEDESSREEDKKEEEPTKYKGKKFIGKVGDEKYDIPADLEIPVKIDGKTEHFKISELRNIKSGEISYDRKFTELDKQQKEFESTKKQITEPIEQFIEKVKNVYNDPKADPLEPFAFMIDLLGGDSYNYIERVFNNQREAFEELSYMSEAEQENWFLKRRNDHLLRRQESAARSVSDKQAQAELKANIDRVRETHGISEDDYLETTSLMENRGYGEYTKDPEKVARYFVTERAIDRAEGLATDLGYDIDNEDSEEMISELANFVLSFPETTNEEILAEFKEEEIDSKVRSLERRGTKKAEPKQFDDSYQEKSDELDLFDDYY